MAKSDQPEAWVMKSLREVPAFFEHVVDVDKCVIIQAQCVGGQITIGTEFTVLRHIHPGGFMPAPEDVYPARSVVKAIIRFVKKAPDTTFGAIVEFDTAENADLVGPGWILA